MRSDNSFSKSVQSLSKEKIREFDDKRFHKINISNDTTKKMYKKMLKYI